MKKVGNYTEYYYKGKHKPNLENMVHEPIEVIAWFHNLKLEIIRFKWRSTVYNVSSHGQKWIVPNGDNIVVHYKVECKKQNAFCELAYHKTDNKWELVSYIVHNA